jgi:transposase
MDKKELIDLRKLPAAVLHEKRLQVVRLKQKGFGGQQIEELTLVSVNQISKIWRTHCKGGVAALKPKTRGRKKGERELLSVEQQRHIRTLIIDKTPDQMKLSFMLWTRQAVSESVMRLYGVGLSLRCVTNYLKRWGFTCQRPTKKAYAQDDIKVKRFMEEEYPAVAKRAAEEKAEIYWGDETGIDNREHYQRGFAPQGQTPVIRAETKRKRLNMISAVTNQGSLRFMISEDKMTQQKLIEFMERLTESVDKKVFLILDNLKVHHGNTVKQWIEQRKDKIELFYIPPYSPQLNPDEYLNHALKRHVHLGISPRTAASIKAKSTQFMQRLSCCKEEVMAFFRHKNVRYISDIQVPE